jgi:hypothetical protein
MACELAWIGNREDTFLLTCDRRLKLVLDDLRAGSFSELIVEGPLGKLDEKRWMPPMCIYLPEARKSEIRILPGQHPLNLRIIKPKSETD